MKQIKSKERVQKFAEVFTAPREVKAMCDLIPQDIWDDITKTFLEPACGTGNFLEEIYERKLQRCKTKREGLIALASVFGIDIQMDNVQESRKRLLDMFEARFGKSENAVEIVTNNIICGDFLELSKRWTENIQTSLF